MTNVAAAYEYANGVYWNGGQWYIQNLVPGATYQYELYCCQIKTDHHYPVTVTVTGSSTNSHLINITATTSVVATDTILVVAHVKGEGGDLPENLWRDAPEGREASSRTSRPVGGGRLRRQHRSESV